MQSVPNCYPPSFPPASPYPNTTASTTSTTSTDSPGNGAAMSVATPPLLTSNGLPLGQNLMKTEAPAPIEPTKRNQVKNACTNCQKACKKCDDARPCPRCEKYGIADTCVNSVRKERKKGIKRGPYRRRQKNEDKNQDESKEATSIAPAASAPTPTTTTVTVLRPAPPATDFGYPTQLSQYAQNYETYNYAINAAAAVYNQNNANGVNALPVYSTYPAPVLVNGDNTNSESKETTGTNGKNDPTSARILATLMTTNPSYLQAFNGIIGNTNNNFVSSAEDVPKKEEGKQPATPVPSTSNSSGTTSPSVHEEDEKFARLSQLCTAALRENKEAQEKKEAAAAASTVCTADASSSAPVPVKEEVDMAEAK